MLNIKFPKESAVYQIRCLKTNRRYVGSTENLYCRFKNHFSKLKNGTHENRNIQSDWIEFGCANFDFSILEYCEKNRLIEREQFYLDLIKPEFNIQPNAGTPLGVKMPKETVEKQRRRMIGNTLSRGHVKTEETRKKLSLALKGIPKSEETRKKLRLANIGKKHTLESKMKMSISRTGLKQSPEAIRRRLETRKRNNVMKNGVLSNNE